jgi:hypothetical protein
LRPRDFGQPAVRSGEWWGWNEHKTALEYLFWTGDVTTAKRDGFERVYDVPDRVLPARRPRHPDPQPRRCHARTGQTVCTGTGHCNRDRHPRLLPPAGPVRQTGRAGAGRGRRHCPGAGRRLEQAGLRLEGRAPCPQVQPRHRAVAIRPAGLEPRPGAPAVRLSLPHRNLHTGTKAAIRLLRAAHPRGRGPGGPAVHEGRPAGLHLAHQRCLARGRHAAWPGGGSHQHPRWNRWQDGSASNASRFQTVETWQRRCALSC